LLFATYLYRLIQTYRTIIKEVAGEIIWNRTCKNYFFRSATVSELRRFNFVVAFIIVIV
jgi:hypothetical protein